MIRFFVPGECGTKGSAKAFAFIDKNTGRARSVVTNSAGDKAKAGAARITFAAREATKNAPPSAAPIRVAVRFYLPRPKSHLRNSGALKEGSPTHVAKRPDVDKLLRNALDALTGVCYLDDAQIVAVTAEKLYAVDGRIGVDFIVEDFSA